MLRSVFGKTVRDRRRALLFWGLGILVYALFVGAFWPFIRDQEAQLTALMAAFPRQLIAVFGIEDPAEMFSPGGYLSTEAFGWIVPVVLSIYAGATGAQLIAGEEEDNTLDLLMANPISRTRVVVEKWLGLVVLMLILGVILLAAVVAMDAIFGLGIPVDRYAAACLQAALLAILFGSIALAAGALGLGRAQTFGLVGALVVAGFLVNSLGALTSWLDTGRLFSPFYYYAENKPLIDGIDWVNAGVLAGVGALGLIVAVAGFRRRDLGV